MLRARVSRTLQSKSSSMSRSTTTPSPMSRFNSTTASTPTKRRPVLPRLPVPDLHQTLTRYLASLEPLLLEDEAKGKHPFSSSYALRRKWADEFASGLGQVLQDRLIALDKASPNNWLDDNFWLNKAYLEWRAPLLVNSNWWLAFFDDELIPKSALSGETNNNRAGTTFWQLRRAAWLVHRTLEYRTRFDTDLEENTTRTGIWLHENTLKMFNAARIPEPYCDVHSSPNPQSSYHSCILVMLHGWTYAVKVYNNQTLMTPREIEKSLRAVVLDVESRLENGEKAVPVGALSADDRDKWAENLQHLLSLSPTNQQTHQAILHTAMGLSLDHITYRLSPTPSASLPSSPSTPPIPTPPQHTLDSHLHTIRGTELNFANRFYDKAFTLIVDPSTRAGATGEHSHVDALVPSIIAEYAVVQGVDVDAFTDPPSPTPKAEVVTGNPLHDNNWTRLDWIADSKIHTECQAASSRAQALIVDSDDSVLWFSEYATEWIKGANMPPDAYIQMALQLAWYKTRQTFTATYETVLTRMFKHGRTETLRTLTKESREWVLSMVDPSSSNKTKHTLLHLALAKHTKLTREAATGRGIDRHLLGLRLLLRPLSGESSPLFDDELFERSAQWKLSTSGLSAGHLFKGTGFGAAYEDGYGINYLAAPDMIKFGIESKFSNPSTSTASLKAAIVESLHEMKAVCLAFQQNVDRVHASL